MEEAGIEKKNKSEKKKKNGITVLQTLLCIVLCLVFKLLSTGTQGEALIENTRRLLQQTVTYEQLTEVFGRFFDNDETTSEPQTEEQTVKSMKLSYSSSKKALKKEEQIIETTEPPEADEAAYAMTAKAYIPAKGDISSAFGYRTNPVSGEYSLHSGIDIAADFGSPVRAAYYGIIDRIGESEISGNFIVMTHPGGLETRYYHCGEIYVSAGMVIRGGEIIADVGDTGRSTGPHLHFEIRVNGTKIDPEKVLDKYGV